MKCVTELWQHLDNIYSSSNIRIIRETYNRKTTDFASIFQQGEYLIAVYKKTLFNTSSREKDHSRQKNVSPPIVHTN